MQKTYLPVFFSLLLMLGVSCKKHEESIGPEYASAKNGVNVGFFTAAIPNVDFENGEVQYFSADLSERVSWTITLEGQESKAVKVINGLSDKLTSDNSSWNGAHDGLHFFDNETVKATLSFLGTDINYVTEFTIDAPLRYEEAYKLGNGFETSSQWLGPWFDPGEDNGSGVINTIKVQGKKAFLLKGTDKSGNYYMGVLRKPYNSDLPADPTEVYFNVYVYGTGDPSSRLKLAGKEDENGNGTFEDAAEDAWEKEIALSHTGWKLMSFKYSSFDRATAKNFGGSGNNKQEPDKIVAVDFALLTGTPGSYAEVVFDFPIITIGEPFQP